ncbi:Dirigent protein [Rhynchospora pubera]|uniref:Dirigent protein n=1 Tax=Rhynchospora pubera TaxID=906938 RepID=A0AAV8DRW2_9POAL|nr:Dirigent protein [Rhynchospora pubera]
MSNQHYYTKHIQHTLSSFYNYLKRPKMQKQATSISLSIFTLFLLVATAYASRMLTEEPTAGSAIANPAATSAASLAFAPVGSADLPPAGDQPLTFYMHDILGGSNPSARIVAGIVDDVAVSSQLPFARPNGAVLPLDSNVNVNSGNNGAINNNNIPFLTGLGGTTNAVNTNNGGNANGVPFFAGGNLPEGTTLQKLLFGTMTVVDDELTEGPELGTGKLGKAQGFYVASSIDGASQTLALTTMFKAGEYADSISFFGVHRTIDSESHLAIIGGTGKYVNARGFAKVAVVHSAATQHETDGVETVLEFSVYLAY